MALQVEVDGVFFETMIAEVKKNCLLVDYLLVKLKIEYVQLAFSNLQQSTRMSRAKINKSE